MKPIDYLNSLITGVICLCVFFPTCVIAAEPSDNLNTSFTDYVKQSEVAEPTEDEDEDEDKDKDDSNWINTLVNKVSQKGSEALSSTNEEKSIIKRSNASVFDIAGVMLRMDYSQVVDVLQKRGYKKISEILDMPNFIRWRFEEACKNQGVVGYERTENCVVVMARENNYQYVQEAKFTNFNSKETIKLNFTSNFTGNKVYRILYTTDAANITGNGPKSVYLQNIKIFDFWKKVNQKYGKPDNKEQIIWGMGENKPSLRAKTGKLLLEDPMLLDLDYSRMSREDKKFMNTAIYTF